MHGRKKNKKVLDMVSHLHATKLVTIFKIYFQNNYFKLEIT